MILIALSDMKGIIYLNLLKLNLFKFMKKTTCLMTSMMI